MFVLQTNEEFRRLWEVAVNHAKTFVIKIKFFSKVPLDFKARPREKMYGAVSAMVRLIAVGLGQDSLYVMINQYKWTQLLLLGYSLAGAHFWHLEGI